ncbi:MAG: hypothetical protein JWO60_1376 [Frankiales bacterium]|nr:hypothetical protein [Frankiales bacterium]
MTHVQPYDPAAADGPSAVPPGSFPRPLAGLPSYAPLLDALGAFPDGDQGAALARFLEDARDVDVASGSAPLQVVEVSARLARFSSPPDAAPGPRSGPKALTVPGGPA